MRQAGLPLTPKQALPTTTLIYGDCLEVMPTLPPQSVQMVFADLPYHVAKHLKWDAVAFDLVAYAAAVAPLLNRESVQIFTANMRFAVRLMAMPFSYRHDLVWHKQCPTNIFAAKRQPLNYHEHVLIFCEGKHIYRPQMLPESERGQVLHRKRTRKAMSKKFFGESKEHASLVAGPLLPRSVLLNITRDAQRKTYHPTQKPVALLEWLIRTYTNEGDTVLDPVFGSCTTGVACLRTGRNFIGIEKDKTYYDIGCKRVAEEKARIDAEH